MLARIAAEGLVVSEAPPGGLPLRRRFLVRNRLIAALSGGTVVVEAGVRSGALSTARHARRIGRPVLAVPGPVTSGLSAGCHLILRQWPEARAGDQRRRGDRSRRPDGTARATADRAGRPP